MAEYKIDKYFAKSIEKQYLSQKITLVEKEIRHNYIARWSDSLLAQGRYGFALAEFKEKNNELSDVAVKFALKRMTDKGKLLPVFKGYYLIIPPQYATKGILPPYLFLDAFMKYLHRPYYVALLNAAALHGASHQQPQEYFVMTSLPVMRPTHKKGLRINYISIKNFPKELIDKKKTEAGYLNLSNPALTACDLVQFEKRVGGLNRVATVINELAEAIKPDDFSPALFKNIPVSTLQRLGFLLEVCCSQIQLADALFEAMANENLTCFRIPLKPNKAANGYSAANRWKVIANTLIEIDE